MSNKRVRLKEYKRKQKQKKQIAILIGALIVLFVVGVFGFYGYGVYARSYVMTYEGKRVSVEEFKFGSTYANSENSTKDDALNALLMMLTINKKAADEGLTLSETDMEEVVSYADYWKYLYEYYGTPFPDISDARLHELLAAETYYKQLLEIHTADYVIDEDAFAEALAYYMANNQLDYYDIQLKDIYTGSKEVADEAYEKLMSGEAVDAVIAEYSIYYEEETGVEVLPLSSYYLDDEINQAILAMDVSDFSEVYDVGNNQFAIFIVDSITIPSDEEVEVSYREQYIAEQKALLFEDIVVEWISQANYTINQKGYDAAW